MCLVGFLFLINYFARFLPNRGGGCGPNCFLVSTLTEFAWDVTGDSNDNIYVTGFSANSFGQNSGWKEDILLVKFNTDGIKL